MSPVPLLDLKAQYHTIQTEIDAAILNVVRKQQFILGPEVQAFESEIATYCRVPYAIGVSSGSDALLMALLALGIGPGDEVITSAYSFFATAGSIIRCGAQPVFVDIDLASYNLAPEQVEKKITSRTKAILPVHLFGRCAPIAELKSVASGIPIIEDAAQAIGAEYQGQRAGALGQIGCLSFFPSKNLGGYGDGGMITTQDADLAKRLRAIRVHGQMGDQRYFYELIGGNFRLDALQAAVLRVKLTHLETWSNARRKNAERYRQLFQQQQIPVVLPPQDLPGSRDVYNQFVIRTAKRDGLMKYLTGQGIGCAIYYPQGLHLQPCFSNLGYRPGDLPNCEQAARESLALPIYPELTDSQLVEVVEQIAAYFRLQS